MTDESIRLRIGVAAFFAILLAGFLGGLLIYGCEGKCTVEHPENCDKRAPTISERTLVIWNLGEPEEIFKEQLRAFSEKYGNKVHFKYESFTDEEEYESRLIDALAAGEGPDMFAIHYTWLLKHKNKIAPLPENRLSVARYREIFQTAISDSMIVTEEEKGVKKERIYGVSYHLDTLALYYNKQAFANLPPPYSISPREKWDDLQKQVAMLTRRGQNPEELIYTGIAMGRGDNIRHAADILSLLFVQHGASVFSADLAKAAIGSEEGQKAFALYHGFVDPKNSQYSWNSQMTATQPGEKDLAAFLLGKTAMIFGYSDMPAELKRVRDSISSATSDQLIPLSSLGSVPVPQLVASDEQKTWGEQHNLAQYYPFVVSKDSKYLDTAWEALVFMAQKEHATRYAALTQKPSSRRDLSAKQAQNIAKNPHLALIASQLHLARPFPVGDKAEYAVIMKQAADAAADGSRTVEMSLTIAQKQLQCVLDKLKGKPDRGKCTEITK